MINQDLRLNININPYTQPPITSQPINAPNAFNSGTFFEKVGAFKNLALVSYVGYAGTQVFSKATGSVGAFTGRTDLQRKINRATGAVGTLGEFGLGFVAGGVAGVGAVGVKQTVTFAIDVISTQIQRNIDTDEARFRSEQRGALINESRSR